MRGKSPTCRRALFKIVRSMTAKGRRPEEKVRNPDGKSETCRASQWPSQSQSSTDWGVNLAGWGVNLASWGGNLASWGVNLASWCVNLASWGVNVGSWGVDVGGWGVNVASGGVDVCSW